MQEPKTRGSNGAPTRYRIGLALLSVYLIWGSTYLAIRIAIESCPPFLMAAVRFFAAGTALWIWTSVRGAPAPTFRQWRDAAIVGVCLLFGGNGGVTYAEQFVPSGIAALLVATVPIFLILFAWFSGMTDRPSARAIAGLLLGLLGVLVLSSEGLSGGSFGVFHSGWSRGVIALLLAAVIWAAGSLYAKRCAHPASSVQGIAMQMLTGAAALLLASAISGELNHPQNLHLTARSIWAWIYLVTLGAIVAFSAYIWLVRACSPGLVGTYAFVNPLVAVFLGWLCLREPLTPRILISAGFIVSAVVLVIRSSAAPARSIRIPKPRKVGAGVCEQE